MLIILIYITVIALIINESLQNEIPDDVRMFFGCKKRSMPGIDNIVLWIKWKLM